MINTQEIQAFPKLIMVKRKQTYTSLYIHISLNGSTWVGWKRSRIRKVEWKGKKIDWFWPLRRVTQFEALRLPTAGDKDGKCIGTNEATQTQSRTRTQTQTQIGGGWKGAPKAKRKQTRHSSAASMYTLIILYIYTFLQIHISLDTSNFLPV